MICLYLFYDVKNSTFMVNDWDLTFIEIVSTTHMIQNFWMILKVFNSIIQKHLVSWFNRTCWCGEFRLVVLVLLDDYIMCLWFRRVKRNIVYLNMHVRWIDMIEKYTSMSSLSIFTITTSIELCSIGWYHVKNTCHHQLVYCIIMLSCWQSSKLNSENIFQALITKKKPTKRQYFSRTLSEKSTLMMRPI